MRFQGSRRALALTLIALLMLTAALWRAGELYVASARRQLGPVLIARLQEQLGREVHVDRLALDRPGILAAYGVRVARGKTLREGEALSINTLKIRYNPALLGWASLLTRGAGQDTRAYLTAAGIEVREPAPLPPERLLTAASASAVFDLGPLLHGGDVLGAVGQVKVAHARTRLKRGLDGHWSFERLLPKQRTPLRLRFRGQVMATDAEVTLEDHRAPGLSAPQQNRFRGDVDVDFAAYPSVRFRGSGAVGGPHGGTVEVAGHRNGNTQETFFTLRATSGDAPYWYHYFVRPNTAVELAAGAGAVAGTIWNSPGGALQYRVDLGLRQAAGKVYGIASPVRHFTGSVGVDSTLLTFRGVGDTAGVPVRAEGRVEWGTPARMQFRLSTPAMTLAALHELFPRFQAPADLALRSAVPVTIDLTRDNAGWSASGAADASVLYRQARIPSAHLGFQARFGEGLPPDVRGTVEGAVATYRGVDARAVRATFQWSGEAVQLQTHFEALGGRIQGKGWMDLRGTEPHFYLLGSAREVEIDRVPLSPSRLKIAGRADAEFVAAGTEAAPHLSAFLRAAPVQVNDERVDAIEARVRYTPERLEIPYASLVDRRVQASLSGSITPDRRLHLRATAAGIQLQHLLAGRLKEPVMGSAYLSGEVSGTVDEPQLSGIVQVYQPGFGEYSADYFETRIQAASARAVQLLGAKLVRGRATATADEVRLTRDAGPQAPWQVRGNVEVRGLTPVSALRLAGMTPAEIEAEPLTGTVERLSLMLRGPLGSPRVGFAVRLAEAAARKVLLGTVDARGDVDLARRQISLGDAAVTAPGLSLTARGTIDLPEPANSPGASFSSARVRLDLHAGRTRLTPLLSRFVPRLASFASVEADLASADGQVTGPVNAPTVAGEIRLADVVVNGRAVPVAPVHVEVSAEAAMVRGLHLQLGPGTVDVPVLAILLQGTQPPRTPLDRIAGDLALRNVPVTVLQQLLEDSPYYRSEAGRSVRDVLEGWRQPVAGSLTATAAVPLAGEPEPAGPLDRIARALRARTGPATATGRIEAPDLSSPPAPLRPGTRLLGEFTYSARRLEVKQLLLEQPGRARIAATGFIDGPMTPRGTMRLTLSASGVRLDSLARLPLARVRETLAAVQPLRGSASLQGELTGDPQKPHARFSLALEQPEVAGLSFDSFRLNNAEYTGEAGEKAHLVFASAALVKHLAGKPDATLTASGSLPLAWPGLVMARGASRQLHIEVPQQSLAVFTALANEAEALASQQAEAPVGKAASIFRALAATDGNLQAAVTLGGTADAPSNSGEIALTGATIKPAGLETEIRNFEARVALERNVLRVQRFHGDSSRGGSFDGSGEVTLGRAADGNPAARLDLLLDIDAFRFNERRLGSAVGASLKGTQVQGTLRSVSPGNPARHVPLTLSGEWPSPTLSGGLLLDDARVVLAVDGLGTPPARQLPGDVRLNVRLLAGNNVWLRNPGAQLRFTGGVLAGNTLAEPVLSGDLHAARGTLNLPTLRLRNVGGLVRVAYDPRSSDLGVPMAAPVYVELSGTSSVRIQRTPGSEPETYDLTVEIRGSPSGGESTGIRPAGLAGGLAVGAEGGLTVTVRTDPPLPTYQIEALIRQQFGAEGFAGGGSNVVEALRTQIEEAFAVNLASAITSPIEERLQSALGLSIFSIDIGVSQPLRVQVGRRLFGPLFGTVTQEFSPAEGTQQRRFEVYYRVSPQLRIGFRQEDPIDRQVFFISGGFSF